MFRIPDTAPVLTSRRTGVAAACLAMTVLMAACGSGDRVKPFQPTQIIAFGDETSAFDDTATTGSPLVSFDGIPMASGTALTASVPYRARYTINVVADAPVFPVYCKTLPTATLRADCVSVSAHLVSADYPTSDYFYLPQPTKVYGYRLVDAVVPIVNEVSTGDFRDATTGAVVSSSPSTIYNPIDHLYYCSTDFADDHGNWVQRLAHGLGGGALSIAGASGGCPQDSGNGRSFARWGARVNDVDSQVTTNLGQLRDGVLVTMLAGQNDIMDAFDNVMATPGTQDAAHKLMRDKGAQLAGIINRIVATGARVVYLTVPDMGSSPGAQANPGLATSLTHAFNEGYRGVGESKDSGGLVLSVLNNGHKIVKADGYNHIAALAYNLGSPYNNTAACQTDATRVTMPNGQTIAAANLPDQDTIDKALLLNCRSNNLRLESGSYSASPPTEELRAAYTNYLWADKRRLAPAGHATLANLAVARIRDQL